MWNRCLQIRSCRAQKYISAKVVQAVDLRNFDDRSLPHTEQRLYGDTLHPREGECSYELDDCARINRTRNDVVFSYDRVAEDGIKASFSSERPDPEDESSDHTCIPPRYPDSDHPQRLSETLKALSGDNATESMLSKPYHIVQIRTCVNAIHLPQLSVDLEDQSLRFHWKELFTKFYVEEKVFISALKVRVHRPVGLYY